MSKIIITNKTSDLSDAMLVVKVFELLAGKLNVSQSEKQNWSYPVPITIYYGWVCLYSETKTGTKTFTFMDGGKNE